MDEFAYDVIHNPSEISVWSTKSRKGSETEWRAIRQKIALSKCAKRRNGEYSSTGKRIRRGETELHKRENEDNNPGTCIRMQRLNDEMMKSADKW